MSELMVRENNLPTISDPQMWAERRQQFNQWVNTQLRENVDFGEIPGTNKATLLKPGAEKIIQVYGCSPDVEVTVRDQDPNTGYLYVEVTVRLVSIQSGAIVATGLGSCSSFESKYRYRWEYYRGSDVPTGDEWESFYSRKDNRRVYRKRVHNPDLVDVWNTVLKMAKKRALVDAALTISGASEKFTQDVEDFDEDYVAPQAEQPPRKRAPVATTVQPQQKSATPDDQGPAPHWIDNERIRNRFWRYCYNEKTLSEAQVYEALGVDSVHDFAGTMQDAKDRIEEYIAEAEMAEGKPEQDAEED